MSPEEWDQSPWWYTASLIEGLIADGTLKDPNAPDDEEAAPTPGPSAGTGRKVSVDLSGSTPLPGGFQTRRVG